MITNKIGGIFFRAMLSGIILVVFIMCYCCHKTNRKSQSHLPTYWRDPGLSLEIYTVESGQNVSKSSPRAIKNALKHIKEGGGGAKVPVEHLEKQ